MKEGDIMKIYYFSNSKELKELLTTHAFEQDIIFKLKDNVSQSLSDWFKKSEIKDFKISYSI